MNDPDFYNGLQEECLQCSDGTYASTTGNSDCSLCQPGTTTNVVTGYAVCMPTQSNVNTNIDANLTIMSVDPNLSNETILNALLANLLLESVDTSTSYISSRESVVEIFACPPGHYCTLNLTEPIPCPPGTYRELPGAQDASQCVACPAGSFCVSGSVQPATCAVGQYQPSTSATSVANCEACPANFYCPMPFLKEACPTSTVSLPGSKSQLDCRCSAGYYCKYKEMVSAVVTLNISLNDWNSNTNDIQNKLKNALAAAAGVSPDKVSFSNARARTTSSRRLLALHRPLHSAIDVVANVMDTRSIHDLDRHLESHGVFSKGHIWMPNHVVSRSLTRHMF